MVMRPKLADFGTNTSHKYLRVSEAAGRVWVSMRIVQGSPLYLTNLEGYLERNKLEMHQGCEAADKGIQKWFQSGISI